MDLGEQVSEQPCTESGISNGSTHLESATAHVLHTLSREASLDMSPLSVK